MDTRDTAPFIALIPIHVCIQLFLRSHYISFPHNVIEGDLDIFIFMPVVFISADIVVQFFMTLEWDYARCGCTFIITYTYWVLPSATTLIDIFIASWAQYTNVYYKTLFETS